VLKVRKGYSSGKLEMPLEGNWQIFLDAQGACFHLRMHEEYMMGSEEIFSSGHMIGS